MHDMNNVRKSTIINCVDRHLSLFNTYSYAIQVFYFVSYEWPRDDHDLVEYVALSITLSNTNINNIYLEG
jgi:hypothetical protein